MKTKLLVKFIVVLSLCLAVCFVFTACKDDEIYAGSDDFQSYPDYWNDFNDDSGDIYIPNTDKVTSGDTQNSDGDSSNTSSEDFTANFTEGDDDNTSDVTDTDRDGTPDVDDNDDDNDGIPDDKDKDDNGNGTPDDEEKPDYSNQGPLVFS